MAFLPVPQHDYPRCWWIFRVIGRLMLLAGGMRLAEGPPAGGREAVLIAAPHTSNWDYVWAIACCWTWGLHVQWLGKDSLFASPIGWFLRLTGGVSVDRSGAQGLVDALAARFRRSERMLLMIPAEGTRSRRDAWKSGFYHISRGAEVPCVLGYLDYTRKVVGFGPLFTPTGDVRADMDVLRAFYGGVRGKFPAQESTIRLPQEDDA